MHAFVARLPQTSQSCSAAAEGGGGSAGSADAAEEEAGADTDASGEGGGADASGEGGVGVKGTDNDGIVEVDGLVAALDGFSPFFFVMGWCVGLLEARLVVAGASTASVHHTRGPSAQGQGVAGEGEIRRDLPLG